jgi:hypothetical protein
MVDSSGEISLCSDFHVPPPGGQAVNRIGPKLGSGRCPKGTNWKNGHIRTIAPIVTKRACLTDRQTDGRTPLNSYLTSSADLNGSSSC